MIERRSVTRTARLPDAAAHGGLLPAAGGGQRPINIHPNVAPYLKLLFPVPDGASFGDGTAELRHAHRDPTDERMGVLKLDWQVRSGEHLMFRYSDDWAGATTSLEHPLFFNDTSSRSRFLTAQHQRIFGASALNSLRIAVNRTAREDDVLSAGRDSVIDVLHVRSPLRRHHSHRHGARRIDRNDSSGVSAACISGGRHVHVGAGAITCSRQAWTGSTTRSAASSYSRYGGEFRFRNLEEFLTLRRNATSQADRFTGNLPGTDTAREMSQHYVALFASGRLAGAAQPLRQPGSEVRPGDDAD